MKQPLMLPSSGLPPAQAEALYETVHDSASPTRPFAGDAMPWPGEDWEDDEEGTSSTRAVRPSAPSPFPRLPFKSLARH